MNDSIGQLLVVADLDESFDVCHDNGAMVCVIILDLIILVKEPILYLPLCRRDKCFRCRRKPFGSIILPEKHLGDSRLILV